MEYLESTLFKEGLVDSSADSPNRARGFGRMIYYAKNRRVLTAAPRKRKEHIHVVFAKSINMTEVRKEEIPLGNGNDVILSENIQIDKLVDLMKRGELMDGKVQDNPAPIVERTIEGWVKDFYEDTENVNRHYAIVEERRKFIVEFIELKELRDKVIDIFEFKKRLDQKAKTRFFYKDEKINIWGFSGFSGQMFFNQLCNQAEYLDAIDDFTKMFLEAIHIPEHEDGDYSWTKDKFERFGTYVNETKKKAIANGYPPQKCPNSTFMTFFLSFFWAIQNLKEYPIFYKASRDGLNYLGYSDYDDQNVADSIRYVNFVGNLDSLQMDIAQYIKEENLEDMVFISHFLWYVKNTSEEEFDDGDDVDPIVEDPFALRIRDVFYDQGYKMSEMVTTDSETIGLDEKNFGRLVWHYSGHTGKDVLGVLFIWENEEDYDADIYLENSEGQFIKGIQMVSEGEEEFLDSLEKYFKKAIISKKPYTIVDVAKETYVNKEMLEEWLELLAEQKQVILYGPPGTGKTFLAERLAKVLTQQSQLVELIQFHPSYTYEEFIEGLRPELVKVDNTQQISIKIEPGIFSRICSEARKPENQQKSYVLIIDEINRANTAKVFGELLYALEYRNNPIPLPYSKKNLIVPDNIYIIGTMNTTDRSLAQLDFALRRRFQFIPFSTKETDRVLEDYLLENQSDMVWVADLVRKVNGLIDDPDISIGHSYFIGQELSLEKLERIWKYQIIPYLEECFVHDREKLAEFDLQTLLDMVDFNE